ncbi:MAG: molybdopterin molybdenumtransferase MoeA [Gammaproteobacteria bacterium]|nr:molybdopterin molybdenumtransferase MoeA [Gammaproteobacteria bacterium]
MSNKITPATSCASPVDTESISVALALEQIRQLVTPISDFETLPIRDCLGRINYENIVSPINVPAHANSAMDGYAIAFASLLDDGITELEEIGTAYAGIAFDGVCSDGQCLRIMTGAVIPQGTDTVIMQEQVELDDAGRVRIDAEHSQGENVRLAGEDIAKGQAVIMQGAGINPANLGVLASLGIDRLSVYRKPVVAFFSTGDELISLGQPLEKGKIYDSNRYSLFGLLSGLPVDMLDLGVIRDEPASIRHTLIDASERADLIITTGGVSVGEADYIKTVLGEIGDINFWKIAIKPGRPLTFGRINQSLFMGLPGNPVAVMVTFNQFTTPAIQQLSGAVVTTATRIKATSVESLRKLPGRMEIQRGIAKRDENNTWQVAGTGKQGSGILSSMSKANCFILLPEENTGVEPGDTVDIQLFDWD